MKSKRSDGTWKTIFSYLEKKASDSQARAAYMRRAQIWKVLQTLDPSDPMYQDLKAEYDSLEQIAESYTLQPTFASKDDKFKDRIPGGLADKKKPSDFDKKELEMGAKDEASEHAKGDKKLGQEIAMDHLVKDPHFYSKEKKKEKKASLARQAIQLDVYGDTYQARIKIENYAAGGGMAVMLVDQNTGEPLGKLSVNPSDGEKASDGAFWLKDWGENEPIVRTLREQGYLELTGNYSKEQNFPEARLTEKALTGE